MGDNVPERPQDVYRRTDGDRAVCDIAPQSAREASRVAAAIRGVASRHNV